MDEVRRWWRELRNDWPDILHISRRRGLIKSLPDLAQAVFWTTLMVIVFAVIIAGDLLRTAWSRTYPLSQHNMDKRYQWRKWISLRQLIDDRTKGRPVSACRAVHSQSLQHRNKPNDSFFGRFPPEIRRHIITLAFGERTLHMDLDFRHPLNLVEKKPYGGWDMDMHARIHNTGYPDGSHLDKRPGKTRSWKWFGCVCHRFDVDKSPPLAYGRRCNYRWACFGEPDTDRCLHGTGKCGSWPGEWPAKCQIGIMGWMLSCKRA
jgi:hypothetical protein